MHTVFKALLLWCLILLGAVANGTLRQAVLLGWLGTTAAYVLSGLMLSALILAVALAGVRWLGLGTAHAALGIGLLWLGLTLVFEFGLGRAQGKSWAELAQAYTFQDGNLWPLVLLVTLLAPWVALRLRGAGPG